MWLVINPPVHTSFVTTLPTNKQTVKTTFLYLSPPLPLSLSDLSPSWSISLTFSEQRNPYAFFPLLVYTEGKWEINLVSDCHGLLLQRPTALSPSPFLYKFHNRNIPIINQPLPPSLPFFLDLQWLSCPSSVLSSSSSPSWWSSPPPLHLTGRMTAIRCKWHRVSTCSATQQLTAAMRGEAVPPRMEKPSLSLRVLSFINLYFWSNEIILCFLNPNHD